MSTSYLFSVAQAMTALERGDTLFLDARYQLTDAQAGPAAFARGRIPGAWFFDQSRVLVGPCTGKNGRHPLPSLTRFRQLLDALEINADTPVVIYDDLQGQFAARLWWMLRWAGLKQVALLDGGWQAWVAAGGQVDTTKADADEVSRRYEQLPTALTPEQEQRFGQLGQMPLCDRETILAQLGTGRLCIIDARAAERYRGEVEPMDPVAGHIPGALNRPTALNLQADGCFKAPATLRHEFELLLGGYAPEQVVHQCGSGITACHNVFAMELAGLSGSALYGGSWSEWVAHEGAPVATGAQPGGRMSARS